MRCTQHVPLPMRERLAFDVHLGCLLLCLSLRRSPRGKMAAQEHDARNLVDKYKEQVVSEVTAGYAKEMAAMIIGYGLPGTRRAIMETLEKEASEACKCRALEHARWKKCRNHRLNFVLAQCQSFAARADKTGHYEIALDRFCHYLAIVETDPSTTMVSEMRATLTSNVGACLHNLGLVDEAVQYYERALQEFKATPFSIFSRLSPIRLVYGDLMAHRCTYIEQKLARCAPPSVIALAPPWQPPSNPMPTCRGLHPLTFPLLCASCPRLALRAASAPASRPMAPPTRTATARRASGPRRRWRARAAGAGSTRAPGLATSR
jgi:hypothetical protein